MINEDSLRIPYHVERKEEVERYVCYHILTFLFSMNEFLAIEVCLLKYKVPSVVCEERRNLYTNLMFIDRNYDK